MRHAVGTLLASLGLVMLSGVVTVAEAPPAMKVPADAEQAKACQRDWAKYHGLPLETKNSLGMEFLLIPPGEFQMGSPADEAGRLGDSEGPVDVTLTNAFYLAKCEVTQQVYQTVTGKNPSWFRPDGFGKELVVGLETAQFPVENVNCLQAAEFCKQLTALEHKNGTLSVDWVYRLPTEAQWEYACRAGTETPWHTGRELTFEFANIGGHSKLPGTLNRTTTVGRYPPNAWGLHDMHGNVAEWCNDGLSRKLPGGRNPFTAPLVDFPPQAAGFVAAQRPTYQRLHRGGWFGTSADYCRSACRLTDSPLNAGNTRGLRVARNYVGGDSLPAANGSR